MVKDLKGKPDANAGPGPDESFEDFKNSFSYGSRTDLNFKFLKHLPADQAAGFIQGLFRSLADALDDGDLDRLFEYIEAAQRRVYAGPGAFSYDDGPFQSLSGPLPGTQLALLSSSGQYVAGHDPAPFGESGLTQEEAVARIVQFLASEPSLSVIPVDAPPETLRVRHPGYDPRAVIADPNVALPLDILREEVAAGRLGSLHPEAYTFVGACAQIPLINEVGPRWVERFRRSGIEAMLLVPV